MDLNLTEMDHSSVVQNAAVTVILSLAALLGIPGNILVIWIITFNMQKKKSPTVVLILNLAIADVLVLISLPLWIYSFVYGWSFGQVFCKLLTFIIHCNMYVSVFLITVMSAERFVAVTYPFTSQRWRKVKVVCVVVLFVWILALLFAIPVLMYQELGNDENGQPQCMFGNFSSETQEILCIMIQFIVAFVIPFLMMSIFYMCIGKKLRGMIFKRHNRTGMVIGTVVVVFFICWMPYHAVNLVSVIALMTKTNEAISDTLYEIYDYGILVAGALVFLNSCANPIIYAFAARNIRSGFQVSTFGKLFDQMTHSESRKKSKDASTEKKSFTLEELNSLQNV
ncbi:leukotriene B4 receptor 1-like [Hypanus sabinus]|uniref:leukotriene B4 receptor 1-like n=1 Tax=Hypanus sabinus TaxID=79690 RepID=UPI0028C4EB1A|nr:leukotriene B4 receptor 1-like [Hypanus sabinus]